MKLRKYEAESAVRPLLSAEGVPDDQHAAAAALGGSKRAQEATDSPRFEATTSFATHNREPYTRERSS